METTTHPQSARVPVPVPIPARATPFTTAPTLSAFLAPPTAYLASQNAASDKLVVGAAVVVRVPPPPPPPSSSSSSSSAAAAAVTPLQLLIRRSRHDFGGGRWETPGGLCEPERDASVLAAAARELREEAGLAARRFVGRVDASHVWVDGDTWWRKLTFLVEVAEEEEEEEEKKGGRLLPVVRLDPDEHDDYVWASEDEVREGRAGERVFSWISEDQRIVVLEAFALARRLEDEGMNGVAGAGGDAKGCGYTDTLS